MERPLINFCTLLVTLTRAVLGTIRLRQTIRGRGSDESPNLVVAFSTILSMLAQPPTPHENFLVVSFKEESSTSSWFTSKVQRRVAVATALLQI
tara:strand:+ start:200 stop:481 length:282 start_codon:yes stop_codon:yes gene_type:complete